MKLAETPSSHLSRRRSRVRVPPLPLLTPPKRARGIETRPTGKVGLNHLDRGVAMHLYRTLLVLALAVLALSLPATVGAAQTYNDTIRSEGRRVGKECRLRRAG